MEKNINIIEIEKIFEELSNIKINICKNLNKLNEEMIDFLIDKNVPPQIFEKLQYIDSVNQQLNYLSTNYEFILTHLKNKNDIKEKSKEIKKYNKKLEGNFNKVFK